MSTLLFALCSDDMRRYFIIGRIIELVILALVIFSAALLYTVLPPDGVLKRYPLVVRARLIIPFGHRWRTEVHPEDVATLERARKGLFICQLTAIGYTVLAIWYFYFLAARLFFMTAIGRC
ncbi:MAG: hypothetical protein IVW54_18980 [Candidatus Binataceae bacterium]|nr:hypothetical protein [Candidatus Binataceae bacterium]